MVEKILLTALAVWAALLVAGFANGVFRQAVLEPRLSHLLSQTLSTLILCGAITAITFLFIRSIGIEYTAYDLLLIGALWVALTVIFEFGFFHYVMGESWDNLLAQYNILKGNLWLFVLATLLLAPVLVDWLLHR